MYIKGSKHQSVKSFQLTITQNVEGNVSPELDLSLNRAKLLVTMTMSTHLQKAFLLTQTMMFFLTLGFSE